MACTTLVVLISWDTFLKVPHISVLDCVLETDRSHFHAVTFLSSPTFAPGEVRNSLRQSLSKYPSRG